MRQKDRETQKERKIIIFKHLNTIKLARNGHILSEIAFTVLKKSSSLYLIAHKKKELEACKNYRSKIQILETVCRLYTQREKGT